MQAHSSGNLPSSASSKKRNIVAPFQQQQSGRRLSGNGKNLSLPDIGPPQYTIDFRSHIFTPLTALNQLRYEQYVGPTNESNWVIPGILLVGAYPASQDDIETFELITSILKLGVRKFVCLQQEYRPGVPEGMWREGLALRPYFEDVQHIVANKKLIPALRDFKIVDYENLSFEHCPIVDCGITDDSKVLELARKLVYEISTGEVIYLHCWGGHGRTGTVVSIMLHIMYGLNPYEAMERCQVVHDLRRCRVEVGSPQTQTQRDQVIRIVNSMMRSYRETTQARVASPSMLTRVMSPASSALKMLFGRSSPSGSAQNSTTNLAAAHVAASVTNVETTDENLPEKESEVQPASSTKSNQSSQQQKSLTFSISTKKEEDTSVNNSPVFLKDTPKTLSTEASEVSNDSVPNTAPSVPSGTATVQTPVATPVKLQTPIHTPVATLKPNSGSMMRQSTEKLKNYLSNPSSPEPNISEQDDHLQDRDNHIDSPLLTTLTKQLSSLSKSNLVIVDETPAGTVPDIVLTKEVLNLQTGEAQSIQRSQQSSGSEAFLSPMRDDVVIEGTISFDKDPSLGIKFVPSVDSYDDHNLPVLTTMENVAGEVGAPPAFRAATAGSAAVGSLDGAASDSDGARVTRAASTTSVGPGQFSRQASISKKDTPISSAPMSRRGSINGFMEPINASSVAPSVGPGQFSRQSSFKRNNEIGSLSRRGSIGGGEFPPAGRFSRQPSLKRELIPTDVSTSTAEVQAAPSVDNAVVVNPSNPPSRRGSFSGADTGVRSTVASARQEVVETTITITTSTNSPSPSAATTTSTTAVLSPISPTAPSTTSVSGATTEEKRRPVPPSLGRSPGSGRNLGGVAQSAGRKIESTVSPISPTDSPSQPAER